jgi:hypothetical protein
MNPFSKGEEMSDKSDNELREMALASLSSEDRVAAARIETIAIIWGKDAGALLVAASALAVEADPGLRARCEDDEFLSSLPGRIATGVFGTERDPWWDPDPNSPRPLMFPDGDLLAALGLQSGHTKGESGG